MRESPATASPAIEAAAAGCPPRLPVYIGLGANLADPRHQVEQALLELRRLPQSRLAAVSPLYRTAPVGPADQPDFINAVACLETALEPLALLSALQQIERHHGRIRTGRRWGPRTLDLDILLIADRELDVPGLRVPHPHMQTRAFVLVPLADIAPPRLDIPGQGPLDALLAVVADEARTVVPVRTQAPRLDTRRSGSL
ncbi:2-amino-4-hydroxy-6-hydroxymethyldihydropteridine diphosphokinase [Halochromatium salexigens]|uniref:2-amino-4-hydroxy-6-hydroxymethyldihydropteridine pyrophosphokinase n=1 Tax=Halochromatium salexigens TaxID=49447 RepID=A0AAJ0UIR0_HALSE|nr:2-amino-4-hydroxy-6-hydroxymethyldihydropteridine diphosphokinase [Halochromatium salexigens]MBK5932253.1 2-amino-4-hydroxy-6-hydroxymethyldihydropteridine diphosphokinase [Halochromatium salexigens]